MIRMMMMTMMVTMMMMFKTTMHPGGYPGQPCCTLLREKGSAADNRDLITFKFESIFKENLILIHILV